jgi:spore coat protein U-like protein
VTNKISFRFLSASVAAVGAALALSPAAFAGNTAASGNVTVTSNVAANCIASVSGNVSLTGYDSVVANASTGSDLSDSSTASIAYTCTKDLPVKIELGYGSNAAGTQRNLANTVNGDKIAYNLLDGSAAWGTNANSAAKSVTGTGTAQSAAVTVVIPKGQNPSFASGSSYADTITANLLY